MSTKSTNNNHQQPLNQPKNAEHPIDIKSEADQGAEQHHGFFAAIADFFHGVGDKLSNMVHAVSTYVTDTVHQISEFVGSYLSPSVHTDVHNDVDHPKLADVAQEQADHKNDDDGATKQLLAKEDLKKDPEDEGGIRDDDGSAVYPLGNVFAGFKTIPINFEFKPFHEEVSFLRNNPDQVTTQDSVGSPPVIIGQLHGVVEEEDIHTLFSLGNNEDKSINREIFSDTLANIVSQPAEFFLDASKLSTLPNLLSQGFPVHYEVVGNTLFANVNQGHGIHEVFTLHLNTNGTFVFVLNDQTDHAYGDNGQNFIPPIDFSQIVIVKNISDGLESHLLPNHFTIGIEDDVPVLLDFKAGGVVGEDGLPTGNLEGSTVDNVSYSGSLINTVSLGTDELPSTAPGPFSMRDDSLSTLLPELTSNGDAVTYTVTHNVGSDLLTAQALDGEGMLRDVFTLELNPNGNYTFTLLSQLDHPTGQGENFLELNLGSVILATDFDGDSANLGGHFTIKVGDDTSIVFSNPLVQLDDDALMNGNAGGVGDDINASHTTGTLGHSYGADGAGSLLLTTDGISFPSVGFSATLNADGTILTIHQIQNNVSVDVLEIKLNDTHSGDYTVTQLHAIDHPDGLDENNDQFEINYVVTDYDGDSAIGSLSINIDDDSPICKSNLTVRLDDDALPGGIPGGVGDTSPDTLFTMGTLSHFYGADGAGSLLLTNTGITLPSGLGFSSTVSADGKTLIIHQNNNGLDADVLQIKLSDTTSGNYTVTQLHAMDHSSVGHDALDAENDLQFSIVYIATDHDGDTATGKLMINVNDDSPYTQSNIAVQLDDDALGGNVGGTGDVNPDTSFTTGTLSHAYGADGAGSLLLINTGINLPVGLGFSSSISADGTTITIHQNNNGLDADVLQIKLSDTTSGNYTVTQLHAMDHPTGQDENNIQFTINYIATDHDGDTATGNLVINVNDDSPTCTSNIVQLDDDALGGNVGGIGDVAPDTSFTTGILAHSYGADGAGSLLLTNTGITLPAGLGFSSILSADGMTLTIHQTHNGLDADVLQIKLSDNTSGAYIVAQLHAMDHPDGQDENNIQFTINYIATDHDGDPATGNLVINVNDDSPTCTSNVVVQLDDDALGGNVGGTGDVNPDTSFTTGILAHSYGADGAGSLLLTNTGITLPTGLGFSSTVSADGKTLIIHQNNNGLNADVLKVVLTDTTSGAYTVTQLHAMDHPTGQDENNIQFTINYIATDHDGDPATGSLVIKVNDDSPTCTSNVAVQLDDDALGGIAGGTGDINPDTSFTMGILAHSYGADGAGSLLLTNTGITLPTGLGFSSTVSADGKTLIIHQNNNGLDADVLKITLSDTTSGAYTVTQLHAMDHPTGQDENNIQFTINYIATDHDGDPATGNLVIKVNDDSPTCTSNVAVQLDDDALGGIFGGTGDVNPDTSFTTGILAHSYGADGAGSLLLTNTGITLPTGLGFSSTVSADGKTLIIHQNNNGLNADVLKVVLTDTTSGAYTVTQLHAMDHPDGQNENNIQFTINYIATDHDGDPATGSLVINVNDDSPTTKSNIAVQLDDDALGGNVGGTGDVNPDTSDTTGILVHSYGADGAGSLLLTNTGITLPTGLGFSSTVSADGKTLIIHQNNNGLDADVLKVVLTDTTSGAYTVTQLHAMDHPTGQNENNIQFTINYVTTDHDGDPAIGNLVINVNDDSPTCASNVVVQFDDDALVGGIAGGTGDVAPDTSNVSNTITHSYGADGAGSLLLTNTGITLPTGLGFSSILSADGMTLTIHQTHNGLDADVLKIKLTDGTSGTYTVAQLHAMDHPDGNNENDLTFGIGYAIKDHDGDTATGSFTIKVNDDSPTANPTTGNSLGTIAANVILTVDTSGSMAFAADPSNPNGGTRLDVEKAAINSLISRYQAAGNVNIQLVTFSSSPNGSFRTGADTWYDLSKAADVAALQSALAGLTANGATNYVQTIDTNNPSSTPSAYNENTKLVGANVQNISYFLSDGEPTTHGETPLNTGSTNDYGDSLNNAVNSSVLSNWIAFLQSNHINSYALGVSTGASATELDPIAYNGQTNTDTNSVIVTDLSKLGDVLGATFSVGQGVLNYQIGADGGTVHSIQLPNGGATFTYNPLTDNITVTNPGTATYLFSSHILTITNAGFGTLAVNIDTGEYKYSTPTSGSIPAPGTHEIINYSVMDHDGDISGSTLDIVINGTGDLHPAVIDDYVMITNGNTAVIPTYALLANDTDYFSSYLAINGVSNSASGTASLTSGNLGVQFIDTGSANGTFQYGITDSLGFTSVTNSIGAVHVLNFGTTSTLNAYIFGSTLISGNNNDAKVTVTLNGAQGDDVLIGGGGTGAFSLIGNAGDDILKVSANTGHYTANGGAGLNILDLSSATSPLNFTLLANDSLNMSSKGLSGNFGNGLVYSNIQGVIGTSGNDTFTDSNFGGAGSVHLFQGNGGSDTFHLEGALGISQVLAFSRVDMASSGANNATVTGFELTGAGSDLLDLSKLLKGISEISTATDLTKYLKVTYDSTGGGTTNIAVTANGSVGETPELKIALKGVNLVNGHNENTEQTAIIQQMISDNHLKAHH